MAKAMIKVSYSVEGLKGVKKAGGTSRVSAVEKALAGVGGTLESFYFAFGADDVFVVAEVPDQAAAMAMAATVGSSGAVTHYETIFLMTPAEVDAALGTTIDYAPPGS